MKRERLSDFLNGSFIDFLDDSFIDSLNEETEAKTKPKPIIPLIDPSLNNIEFGKKLGEMLSELGINQKDFAAKIDTSEKTVTRYINDENTKPIKENMKAKINAALHDETYYEKYKHMPAEEFGELFAKLWGEFRPEISQEDFARRVGHGNQSKISGIKNGDIMVRSTKEQYDYLSVFLNLCLRNSHPLYNNTPSELDVLSQHHKTANNLCQMLFGESLKNSNEKLPITIINTFIDQLITFPIKAQNLILSYPYAFFDSLLAPHFHRSDHSYMSAHLFIEQFRQLSLNERQSFYEDLRQLDHEEKLFQYNNSDNYWLLTDMILHYHNMMHSAKVREIPDPIGFPRSKTKFIFEPMRNNNVDSFRSPEDKNVNLEAQRHRFEKIIGTIEKRRWKNRSAEAITDAILEDIRYRLNMSPFEWHLWTLCASYVFNCYTDRKIEILLHKSKIEPEFSLIADYIISLNFEERKKICDNPMSFFDSVGLCNVDTSRRYLKAREFFEEFDILPGAAKYHYIEEAERKNLYAHALASDFYIECKFYLGHTSYGRPKRIPIYNDVQFQKKAILQFLYDLPIESSDVTETYKEYAKMVIEDITYKLHLDQDQREIWCLTVKTAYNMIVTNYGGTALEIIGMIIDEAMVQAMPEPFPW